MKCEAVQRVIVEYDEGGLCVADELCVDIHLVQCPDCREELIELEDFEDMLSRGLTHPEPQNHLRDLLGHLDRSEAPSSSRVGVCARRRLRNGAMFRFSMAVALSALALLCGAVGWNQGSLAYFQLPIVEAETGLPVPQTWRPWMRLNSALGNGEDLEAILSRGDSAVPW